jgi:hypothetical protein
MTALTDGAEAPDAMPTLAFQPMIAPSSVAKRKVAGIPGAMAKSVVLPLKIVPVGVPVGKVLLWD